MGGGERFIVPARQALAQAGYGGQCPPSGVDSYIVMGSAHPTTMATEQRKAVIGLTGGIGSGKSYVARLMAELGCAVIDSDMLAHEALADEQVRSGIAERFGRQVFGATGEVDREALAQIVFGDATELSMLEQLIHPFVRRERMRLRQTYQGDPAVVAIVEDCPLLLEKQLGDECDVTIFVQADRATRLRRVARRGWTASELAKREKNQLGLDHKAKYADYVIVNDADEAHCLAQVKGALSKIFSALP
jgi:dephospho-CoA kinase